MALSFTAGSSNVKSRNFKMYMVEHYTLDADDITALVTGGGMTSPTLGEDLDVCFGDHGDELTLAADYAYIVALMQEIGELKADSVEIGIEDDLSIDLNTVGTKNLRKNGYFKAELVELTAALITNLEGVDGTAMDIILESTEDDFVIFINNITYNHLESFKGNDIQSIPISLSKKVGSIGTFRRIIALPVGT